MGNRAVIEFENTNMGIYLHWNGGRDSIEPLLHVAKEYGIVGNGDYSQARLTQIICNTFDGKLGVGIDTLDNLDCDNFDNGVYVIDSRLNIVGRKFTRYPEQNEHDFKGMVEFIKERNDRFFITSDSRGITLLS